MYWLVLVLVLAIGALLVWQGVIRARKGMIVGGSFLVIALVSLFAWMSFWGEALWYTEVGYSSRFWRLVITRLVLAGAGALIGGTLVFALSRQRLASVAGAVLGVLWWIPAWDTALLYVHGTAAGHSDPIFNRDIAFYLFELPFYDAVLWFLAVETLLAILAIGFGLARPAFASGSEVIQPAPLFWRRVSVAAAVLALLVAARFVLAPYHLLLSRFGTVHGAGWTDVWVRRPGYYVAAAVATFVAVAFCIRPVLRWFDRKFARAPETARLTTVLAGAGMIAAVWVMGVWFVPGLFQWLKVTPNEITVEKPFISHNIAFTRRAFGLEAVEDREFPVSDQLTEATLAHNQHILSEIRLWDPRALAAVYGQFQEIRLYYEMDSIDIDRYTLGDGYRQVMVAAREMRPDNLPPSSQTFVNRRFKYTHGYGASMSPVSEFRLEGLPEMFLKDIPPQASFPTLTVERPEIYYGERTHQHVVANSREREFDYPQGEENAYAHYAGSGGVPISSFWRRLLFGWKFDGTKLLVSSYLRPESRILFHREIKDRVKTLAPFLAFDDDPYLVVSGGRIYWIIDGYTTSNRYPYSEPFSREARIDLPEGRQVEQGMSVASPRSLEGANYVRNSVKAVIDAYDGAVDFYVFTPEDPVVRTWSKAFPGLLKPRASMPPELERHVRYPEGLLLAQSMVYSKYHMTDPEVFYNQEDLWVRATEKYYEQVQPVDPYYVMWEPSGAQRPEFILMQPFTPKNRQVLIGWLAGMCDPPNYGRLLAYHFPKDTRVLGTQQVDTKIDQDPALSAQLTLWNQQGKRVIRGNVLVIPINDTLLYVEPIYIQAEVAAYPELRLVVVMHDDRMSYASSFDQALSGLVGTPADRQLVSGELGAEVSPETWDAAASELDGYLTATSEGRFADAGRHLERLRALLQERMPEQ